MKVAITGGTGFVGRHLARALVQDGHEVVLIARGIDARDSSIRDLEHATFAAIGTSSAEKLAEAFTGCDAVAVGSFRDAKTGAAQTRDLPSALIGRDAHRISRRRFWRSCLAPKAERRPEILVPRDPA